MGPTSAGLFSIKFNNFLNNFYFSTFIIFLALFNTLNSININTINVSLSSIDLKDQQQSRHRRATTESLLTVEWEGIQSGDHPDSSIRGFIVEYRAEREKQWHVHMGLIPYKGPNHQYRVQIPKLPTGISYFVRIKVLGSKGEVLVETPEIRARNEIVSIKCEPEELTSPNDIKIKEISKYSIAIIWQPPECGSIGEYQLELKGLNLQQFDVHRQTVSQPQASIGGLIPGTEYSLRIRAIDRTRIIGPWSEELITVSTKGELPEDVSEAQLEYIGDKEVRISWKHLDHPRLQHYEIVLTEVIDNSKQKQLKQHKEEDDEGEKVERTRIAPIQNNIYFGDLKPDTEYKLGVLAYVDHESVNLQRLNIRTNIEPVIIVEQKPLVIQLETGEYEVYWKPQQNIQIDNYILEYKLGNETKWNLLTKQEEIKQQNSYSFKTLKLENAVSIRLLFIKKEENKLEAKTEEEIIKHKSIGNSCERIASSEPKLIKNEEENNKIIILPETLNFKWEQIKCDGHIEGWEYIIWPSEDGNQPLEGTVPDFTSQPQVLLQGLEPSTDYRFKVRHRLPNGGYGPWSPTALGHTGITKEVKEEEEEVKENIYKLRIALIPPRSFLVWTPLPEHIKRIYRFKVSHKPTSPTLTDGTTVEGPPQQFNVCPLSIAQQGADFCLDLRGLELGKQYSAQINYQLDGPIGKWSKKGSPLFFILVDEEEKEEEKEKRKEEEENLNIGQIRIEQIKGKPSKSIIYWIADGPMLNQIRAYQVEIRSNPQQPWHPISGYITAERQGQKQFNVEIDNNLLGEQAEIRLKALGSDGKSVAQSQSIETGMTPCEPITLPPNNASLTIEKGHLILRWSFPPLKDQTEIERCHFHFLVGGILNGAALQRTVDGNSRELKLDNFEGIEGGIPSPRIQLSIHAINKLGAGPASLPISVINEERIITTLPEKITSNQHKRRVRRSTICDPRTDFWCREESFNVNDNWLKEEKALISTPTVSTSKEGSLQVHWRSKGPGRGVFGYRVLYKSPGGGWNPYGQIVPYIGDNEEYNLLLAGLSTGIPYELKIQTLDRNSYVLYTSQDIHSLSTCLPPTQPPSQLAIDAPDARHVRVTWIPVVQSAWKCSEAKVELKIDEPHGRPSVFLDARQSSHVFDVLPAQRMTIRARTTNVAGHSDWSSSVSVSTLSSAQSLAEPIDGPFVSVIHGMPRLSWKGREGTTTDPELVDHFIIEWRTRTEQRWNQLPQRIPFTGWQRPYNIDLDQLPSGHLYEVRIRALDHNLGTAFLSGTVTVQSQFQCRPPHSAPKNLEITPLGPNQLRLIWQPLNEVEWNCDKLWYIIKYSSTEQQGFRNLSSSDTSTIFDSAPFTQWHFQIQAANPAGSGPWSSPLGGQTLGTAPGPVGDFSAQILTPDAVQLSWRPPQIPNGQITGYEVGLELISRGMCQNGITTNSIAGEQPSTTLLSEKSSYTLQQLHPHSRYRIGVAARTDTGAGERITREVQTDQSVPTAPPANFRVDNIGENNAELSWHAPPCVHTNGDITEYEYEIAAADRLSAQIPRVTDVTRSTRVHLTGLVPSTSYSARVRAFTARGPGPWSQELRFQTRPSALREQVPQPRIYATGNNEAQLVWQTTQGQSGYFDKFACQWAPTGTQKYKEERIVPAYNPCSADLVRRYQLPPSTPQVQTHCTALPVRQDPTTLDYRVRAKPQGQPWTQWSPPQKPVVIQPPPPPPPPRPVPRPVIVDDCIQLLALHKQGGSANSLRFAWSVRPSDLLRCAAFIVTVTPRDGREPARQFRVDSNTNQYTVDSLRPGTVYSVSVQPVVNERPCTGMTVDMTTDIEPLFQLDQRPRIVEEKATSITIAWDVPSTIQCSSFIVEYRLETGSWQQMQQRVPCQLGRSTYTATVPGLPTNSAVDFRVRAISLQNQPSNPSPEVRGHTKCSAPDSPPHGLRLDSPTQNEVRLSWARLSKLSWNCDELQIDIGYRTSDQPERILTVPADKIEHIFSSEPNTRWTVRLRATNQAGNSPWGPEQTLVTRQGAPGHVLNMQLTPLSPNEIKVKWSPPAVQRGTIVGYDISYRLKHRLACPEEEPRDVSRDFVTIYNHKDTEYILTGLLPNSLYEVKVQARTTQLGPEETREGATFQQPPSAPPLNLQLTYALERSLSFQWEPVECSQRHGQIIAYEYEIVGQDDWAKLERQIANTSQQRITIDGLTPYTKYVFRVRAYNGVGGGPATENLDVMTAKANAPLPPQDLVVTQEGVSWFTVSWLPPYPPYGPHDRYKLQYQLLSASPHDWKTIEVDSRSRELECPVPGPRLCYNITNLDQGQQYRVKVAAHIEGGNYGPFSQIVIANTLRVVPGAPASIDLIAKTDHSLHVGWKPPYDQLGQITQYRLSWQSLAHPNTRHQSTMVDHPKMDYLIDGLEPETYYNISLSAGTPHGFGPEIWAQFRTDPFRVPSVLQAPILTPEGANTIHVEWTGVVDTQNRISGYIVESRTSDASQWIESSGIVPHEPGRRQYKTRLDGLEPDTLYFVRIKVVDNNQKISEASPESNTRTGCAPPTSPPTSVALHGSSDWKQVRVSWHPPNKQSWLCSTISYELEYHNGSGPAKLADVASGYTEHSLASGPGTAWRVRVRTKNPAGVSPWSPEVELRTGGRPPGEITDLQAEVTSPNSISTNWSPPESDDEITGYTLIYTLKSIGECGPNSAFNRPITKQTKEPNLDLEGLLPDSTYDITVTAHTATQEGKRSKIVTVRTEEASPTGYPKNLRVTSVTSTRAELIWNEIECELRHGRIIGYEYELDDKSGESQNISEQSINRRVSLDRLIPYTEYRARVRGKNSKGEGPFSDYIEFRTLPSAPPPPTDLRIEEQLAHALEISFLPPHPPNGILDQYRIRWTPYKKFNYRDQRVPAYQLECSTPQMRGRLCYRISGLEPEQEYEIQASAHTEHGDWGDWSEPLITPTGIQIIPVLEAHLELDFVHSTSIGVKWRGLDEKDVEHINGYILEYKSEDDNDWTEWNGIIKHRIRQLEYKTIVKGLIESTEYFFRLRVVGKGDKRGGPGPELKAITKCGKPEQPPGNVRIEPLDFEQIKIIWEVPEEITWKCDQVELALHYTNTSGQHKILTFTPDGPKEVLFDSIPGTRWEAKMRTQTIEPGEEPKHSGWSNKAVLITKSPPSEIFLKTNALGPTQGEAFWGLPTEYTDWPWGVDLQYKLIQLGNCKKLDKSMTQPVILENVQDKHVLLDNLYPGSEYEVTVTLRQPPGYDRRIQPKKAVQRFKTEDLPPTGAPHKLRVENRQDTKLGFGWEPPECLEQNGEISQYEYELIGLEDWNQGTREGVSPRTRADIGELQPGSLYRFRVRAFTSAGPGPWSEPIDARTTGSEIGPPRDLTALKTADTFVELAWLPPHPETSPIIAYRVRYGPSSDTSRTQEIILRGDELTCSGYESSSSILTSGDRLCTTVTGLKQLSTYRFAVQAQAASGNWGPFTPDIFATTSAPIVEELYEGGNIKLLSAGHDNLKIKWTPPGILSPTIDRYELLIALAAPFETAKRYDTIGSQTDYHFKGLNPITLYNITVRGLQENKSKWTISGTFATTDKTEPTELDWLGPPTDLRLIEKSDTMLHVTWTPPDIFEPEYRDLLTHYRVTIAPVDEYTMKMGDRRNYTVMVPGNSIKFTELKPQTIYNITVQGGTDLGYGQMIWGAWATLPTGKTWILRLKDRTPNTLTVEWEPIWGFSHRGYILTAKSLHSIYPNFKVGGIKSFDVSPTSTEFTITGLEPASTYNVTLTLKDQMDGAWGVYSTLPPGWYLPRNLKHCDQTPFATSLSWEPVEANMATEYQVRYIHLHSSRTLWIEEESKHRKYLLCPKDPCGRHCYLVFNLEHNPDDYAFMVRAKVNGIWNNWKLAGRPTIADQPDIKERCCIVPPPYYVDNIGVEGTNWEIAISPSPTDKNITRYYIVVDERDPPGDTNWTLLTDKITAHRLHIPYYVAGSFSIETLDIPTNIKIGNGSVIGGYLNYPLQKGKTYNYEIYTKWMMHGDQPVIGRLRPEAFLASGWPWWWLLLLLLLLLLCLLLTCLLIWLLRNCYRDRRYTKNGQHEPLIKEKYERYEHTRGNFEDGYSQGYRAGRGGRRVEEDWRGRDEAFREGYAKGLRDTGDRGMSTSMANLAQRPTQRLGYSSGYMQGFRDGSSGVFGDRITESLLKRLKEQYPDNEEFRTGYIDGFKDGVGGGGGGSGGRFEDSKRIQQSLTELTERLTTIEKTVEKGDEIHSTKIYHVYNQSPEMLAQGQQLVNELEELASGSRRSTLRRHYTPGDYLRYDETSGDYNSLGRSRRSMSATALGRGTGGGDAYAVLYDRDRQHSGSIEGHEVTATTAGRSTAIRNGQYRSRSELAGMGGISPPRRYASQTLLDGARPGPTTTTTNINSKEHSRRDALYELQRELDSLASRSPASGIDFISRQQIPSKWENNPALSSGSSIVASAAQQQQQQRNYEYEQQQQQQSSATTHQWPEDLIEIVHEPMGHTLDRMRRFSTSLSNVERTESAAAAAESEKIDHQEKYKRTYREEYS